MKYFTFERLTGKSPGIESAQSEYRSYLESVRERLPERFRDFNEKHTLRGARLIGFGVAWDELTMVFVGHLNPEGPEETAVGSEPEFASLKYRIDSLKTTSLAGGVVPGSAGYGEVVQDELEVLADTLFEHRMILSGGIEVTVRFRRFMGWEGAGSWAEREEAEV